MTSGTRSRLDRADASSSSPPSLVLLKVHIADRDRHGIHAAVAAKIERLPWVRAFRGIALAHSRQSRSPPRRRSRRNAPAARSARSLQCFRQRFARAINISEVKPLSSASWHSSNRCTRGQDAPRPARMPPSARCRIILPSTAAACARDRLGPACRITGAPSASAAAYIGAHVFPPEADQTADGVAVFQGRLKDLRRAFASVI
jgi:hypothetical protein